MSPAGSDPTAIRSIAVSVEDVVAAVETNRTSDREALLRVTPPFSGRMRARLHLKLHEDPSADEAVTIDPDRLLTDDAPDYPRPAETEDALRRDPDAAYTVERHRTRHEAAVADWRAALPESIRDRVTLPTAGGPHAVDVYVLG
ncbi:MULTISPECIES: hypothetical protein [Salinibaculum]|uniref:hypothetical protein n=1 Tax=Salinibaculum TaxID=2732368 RepID=UPI0030CB9028